jgi:hypothetical protein
MLATVQGVVIPKKLSGHTKKIFRIYHFFPKYEKIFRIYYIFNGNENIFPDIT